MQCATVDTRQFTARATERAATRAAHRQMRSAAGYQQSGGQRAGLSTARTRGQGVARVPHPHRPVSAAAAARRVCMPHIQESICGQIKSTFLTVITMYRTSHYCLFIVLLLRISC